MTNAPLSPAEAALLVEPSTSNAGKCLQAALLALLGRDHIMISETRGFFSTQRTLRLMPGDGQPLPPHLSVVKNAIGSGRGSLFRPQEVTKALQDWFGGDYRRYVHDHLARSLIDRGLLAREDRKFLGLISYAAYRRTASGEARAAPLIRLIEDAGGMRKLIKQDPDRAIRIARAAGVLLVLSPAARRQLPKLKAMVERGDSGGGDGGSTLAYGAGDGGGDGSPRWEMGVELGNFSFVSDMAGMFDGIAGIGDFTGGDGGDGGGDGGDGGGGGD